MLALAALALSMPVMAVNISINNGSNVENNTACLKGDGSLTASCSDSSGQKVVVPGGANPSSSSNNVTLVGWSTSSNPSSAGYSILGEYNASDNATGNMVGFWSGTTTIDGNIYGGYSVSGNATGNNVRFFFSGQATITGNIYGGYSASGGDAFSGNTLIREGAKHIIAGTVSNFQKLEFFYSGQANIGELDTTPNGSSATAVEINVRGYNVIFAGDIKGEGGINKTGNGKLTLEGSTTYAGPTTISTGTLIFNQDTNQTLAGPIGGDGKLEKTGAGTLTLKGDNNTYGGGTTITGGLIEFGNAGNFGSGNVTLDGGGLKWASGTHTNISGRRAPIVKNGGLFDTNGNDVEFGSALAGVTDDGGITKTGDGILTFAVANTYTGATTITGGLIEFGNENNFGSGTDPKNITLNGGGLKWASGTDTDISGRLADIGENGGIFDTNGNDVALGSDLTGVTDDGGIIKTGAGILKLTATNTYKGGTTITGGLIEFDNENNLGSGNITLNGGGLKWADGNTLDISGKLAAIGEKGGAFDTNGKDVVLGSALTGDGGITKTGAGILTLAG
ncbi:MAG: autotransporter-associated beta strand repeat-containing protein, partial [Candidatus Accumulibacter sp.]|nr:autotransporter-associated beta strand repeat-containing protein [Accumulibacter sp.]